MRLVVHEQEEGQTSIGSKGTVQARKGEWIREGTVLFVDDSVMRTQVVCKREEAHSALETEQNQGQVLFRCHFYLSSRMRKTSVEKFQKLPSFQKIAHLLHLTCQPKTTSKISTNDDSTTSTQLCSSRSLWTTRRGWSCLSSRDDVQGNHRLATLESRHSFQGDHLQVIRDVIIIIWSVSNHLCQVIISRRDWWWSSKPSSQRIITTWCRFIFKARVSDQNWKTSQEHFSIILKKILQYFVNEQRRFFVNVCIMIVIIDWCHSQSEAASEMD